ncbi:MAG: hypothetical protein QXL15_04710 [Candidatus Korarchaeota archaeon]
MKSLVHNGVYIPPIEYHGLSIVVRGKEQKLSPEQEQMAIAWVKKLGTDYVKDPVFVKNFFMDFGKALGYENLSPEDVDFSKVIAWVNEEKLRKERMSNDEKKRLREERKKARELLKERYGVAYVDGVPMEISNYIVEPSSIFMGRGQHPLRGRWKKGAKEEDIILNLSPDAPIPPGKWKQIVWEPDSMWIAKWTDKLTEKIKYVWIGESSPIRQDRERMKYDKAIELADKIDQVRTEISKALRSKDPRMRQIATAVYIIDALSMRVGDEKDPDEADTVGATTLRPEHVTIKDDGTVEFNFLGKDSVPWHRTIKMPKVVINNLNELIANARAKREDADPTRDHPSVSQPSIFPDISSDTINRFLGKIMPGLTAKVFRTYHATMTMVNELKNARVSRNSPEHEKKAALVRANLTVAKVCNHYKKEKTPWEKRKERFEQKIKKAAETYEKKKKQEAIKSEKVRQLEAQVKEMQDAKRHIEAEIERMKNEIKETEQNNEKDVKKEKKRKMSELKMLSQKFKLLSRRYQSAKRKLQSAVRSLEKSKSATEKALLSLEKIQTEFELAKETMNWNLQTSIKSYIDPRVVKQWFDKVGFDWKKYYPKSIAKKFTWCFEATENNSSSDEENNGGD